MILLLKEQGLTQRDLIRKEKVKAAAPQSWRNRLLAWAIRFQKVRGTLGHLIPTSNGSSRPGSGVTAFERASDCPFRAFTMQGKSNCPKEGYLWRPGNYQAKKKGGVSIREQ